MAGLLVCFVKLCWDDKLMGHMAGCLLAGVQNRNAHLRLLHSTHTASQPLLWPKWLLGLFTYKNKNNHSASVLQLLPLQ